MKSTKTKFTVELIANSALAALLKGVPHFECDPNSFTMREICAELNCGLTTATKIAREKIKSGEWEKTFKRTTGQRPIESYRLKRR